MSLAENFSITVTAVDIDNNIKKPTKLTIEYRNIAMRHALTDDHAEIEERKDKQTPLTRIHLSSAMRDRSGATQYMKFNVDVLETIAEVEQKIEDAQNAQIEKMKQHRLTIV